MSSEFQFQFDHVPKKKTSRRATLETWVPVAENPILNTTEKEAVVFGDAVESLFLVKPAFLYVDANKGLSYVQENELDYYFTVAKLKKSPYLVLLGEEKKSKNMHQFMQRVGKEDPKTVFYLDLYLSPHFGGVKPKCYLFEKVSLTTIPNTMVLFKEIER